MCIGTIRSNASVCGGASTGRNVETRACKTKDCPSIPLVYFCYVVKMVCQAKTYSLNSKIKSVNSTFLLSAMRTWLSQV